MVGTVCAERALGRRRTAAAAAAALALGVLVSSVATLALLGLVAAVVSTGRALAVAAAVLCLPLALGDALGRRVRPQIPLQVPERWRRTLPLPLASLLYGLLLGTGFSSAVPAFAAWGLLLLVAGAGSVWTGVLAGLALGAGRGLPVLVGVSLAERPGGYRAVRLAGALALALAALIGASPVRAAVRAATPGTDPSVAAGDLAWQQTAGEGILRRADGTTQTLPGDGPAVGGGLVAWHVGDTVTVADRATLAPRFSEQIVGVTQISLSDDWLVLRQLQPGGLLRLIAQSLADTSQHSVIAEARPPNALGRPAIDGDVVVYATASSNGSAIRSVDLSTGSRRLLRTSNTGLLLNPSLLAGRLLYDDVERCSQTVRLGPLNGAGGLVLYRLPPLAGQDAGHERGYSTEGERTPCSPKLHPTTRMLWSTALDAGAAYVTVFGARARARPTILVFRP